MYSFSPVARMAGLGLVLWAAASVHAAAAPAVRNVRIGEYPAKTRFVLDITERVKFRVFALVDPSRVVIDLPEVEWRIDAAGAPAGVVTGFRYGLFRPGHSRMVIDVKAPTIVAKRFILPPSGRHGYRLVLDLRTATRQAVLRQGAGAGRAATRPVRVAKRPSAARPGDGRRVIAIDPGHGGVDPGAIGGTGAREKRITLAQGRELRRQLLATGRYRVVMTRKRDMFVRLRDRIAIAQEAGAKLFVSLHADSMRNRRIRGGSVYTLSETASDKEAAALAAKENKADLIAGIDLSDQSEVVAKILIDLRQRLTKNDSVVFAKMLIRRLGRATHLLRNNHRFAGFAVLKAPDVPSVLVEMGYLSNRADERLLNQAAHRRKIAASIVQAVDDYFNRHQAGKGP